jgi:NOL1/NOP2/sun family putative RNA methylase
VWANTLRADPERIGSIVRGREPLAEPCAWLPHVWRLPAESMPGKWLEFALGELHAQEEISLLPPLVLGAKPGEKVLDLCAAPGNKTARIALSMEDAGLLVANEPKVGRLASLCDLLNRLGITSVAVTREDGRTIPEEAGPFDRILVDAPCTSEGTTRKGGRKPGQGPASFRLRMSRIQRGLLKSALRLVKPGGVVVYSTCTYAPEENEAVLSAIAENIAAIEPIALPEGLSSAPGVRSWEGHDYRPDVDNAVRLWPHHNDTGGFFVARLRRL